MSVTTTYAAGTLVAARGREWVVLPESTRDFLVLRPLGGSDDDIAAVLPGIEQVTPQPSLLRHPMISATR